jgi:hypothetical protein
MSAFTDKKKLEDTTPPAVADAFVSKAARRAREEEARAAEQARLDAPAKTRFDAEVAEGKRIAALEAAKKAVDAALPVTPKKED